MSFNFEDYSTVLDHVSFLPSLVDACQSTLFSSAYHNARKRNTPSNSRQTIQTSMWLPNILPARTNGFHSFDYTLSSEVAQPMLTHVYFHPSDLFPYRPVPFGWMCTCVSLSFIVFHLCSWKIALNHETSSTWLKRNTLLSFLHAVVSSVLLIIAVVRAPEMFDDPLSHSNHFNYALIGLSVGYFLYDFLDCLRNSTGATPAILAHHVVVITFFTHILLHTRNLGYGLHALSLEANSVFSTRSTSPALVPARVSNVVERLAASRETLRRRRQLCDIRSLSLRHHRRRSASVARSTPSARSHRARVHRGHHLVHWPAEHRAVLPAREKSTRRAKGTRGQVDEFA